MGGGGGGRAGGARVGGGGGVGEGGFSVSFRARSCRTCPAPQVVEGRGRLGREDAVDHRPHAARREQRHHLAGERLHGGGLLLEGPRPQHRSRQRCAAAHELAQRISTRPRRRCRRPRPARGGNGAESPSMFGAPTSSRIDVGAAGPGQRRPARRQRRQRGAACERTLASTCAPQASPSCTAAARRRRWRRSPAASRPAGAPPARCGVVCGDERLGDGRRLLDVERAGTAATSAHAHTRSAWPPPPTMPKTRSPGGTPVPARHRRPRCRQPRAPGCPAATGRCRVVPGALSEIGRVEPGMRRHQQLAAAGHRIGTLAQPHHLGAAGAVEHDRSHRPQPTAGASRNSTYHPPQRPP